MTGLPHPRTALIGRHNEIETASALLRSGETPLLTISGPGGVGKTRLALEVARRLSGEFPDGVVFVPLATVRAPAQLGPTIARALGVQATGLGTSHEGLIAHIGERRLLLVLDNLEHLLDAVPLLAELLLGCPNLTILATSRAILRVSGERVMSLQPLPVPSTGGFGGPAELRRNPAVILFNERATAVRPDFRMTDDLLPTVAAICDRLDGLPLAIELAAARIKVLSPTALLERMTQLLPLLTSGARDAPERQRTLRSTIDWSYQLLDERLQATFRRLAIFVGGWSVEGAAVVSDEQPLSEVDALDALEALIEHNLIVEVPGPFRQPRFTMRETIREYGLELLAATGELDATASRHTRYYVDYAERNDPKLYAYPIDPPIIDRWVAEHDNIRSVLRRTIDNGDAATALQLCGAMRRFWNSRSDYREARDWLAAALALPGDVPDPLRARALDAFGAMELNLGEYEIGLASIQRALMAYRAQENRAREARVMSDPPMVALLRGDLDMAERGFQDTLDFALTFPDAAWMAVGMRRALGEVAFARGDLSSAQAYVEASLAEARAIGHEWAVTLGLTLLGRIATERGEYDVAEALFRESIPIALRSRQEGFASANYVRLGQLSLLQCKNRDAATWFQTCLNSSPNTLDETVECVEGVAAVAGVLGHGQTAALLYGATSEWRSRTGVIVPRSRQHEHERHLENARASIEPDRWQAAFDAGRRLPMDAAIEHARQLEPPADASRPSQPDGLRPLLTSRERDVLRLLAAGRSNREIGDTLYLSVRTVERHIANLYGKIDAHNRAEATAWAIAHPTD
ncbi:MAG TPA: LuxR C-terminal-related transcriptional regulator [Thermomicrobiales bacterium]|nr:LuxR C-terminal-related transcriptional regulator [Thermomicrobiales bacterium]